LGWREFGTFGNRFNETLNFDKSPKKTFDLATHIHQMPGLILTRIILGKYSFYFETSGDITNSRNASVKSYGR